MTVFYATTITEIGPEARDLIGGGMLILFAAGAPPELAEISVLHQVKSGPTVAAPTVGSELRIGSVSTRLTAIGETAWKKVADLGHVVINFNGSIETGRPGELYVAPVDREALAAAIAVGAEISISG
ncbi:PTS system, glucitol/sorbitol-specific IIA component [Rhizobiales bacterium GAS188]|nr:PTS system, glucitol/sorbitol-specific IIA component [Rhizobiales bacterium GAS188]